MRTLRSITILISIPLIFSTCEKRDILTPVCDGSTVSYSDAAVINIITSSCMGHECHGPDAKSDDYTTYKGLEPSLLDGSFADRVFDKQDMPLRKRNWLTQEEINTLKCWADAGYPEN